MAIPGCPVPDPAGTEGKAGHRGNKVSQGLDIQGDVDPSAPWVQARALKQAEEQFCLKHTSLQTAVTWREIQKHDVILFIIHKSPAFCTSSQLHDVDQSLLEKE